MKCKGCDRMKKMTAFVLALFCVFGMPGCLQRKETMYQLGLMVDGVFYEKSSEPMPAEVDESAIIGCINAYTDTFPDEDGETNISKDLINTPYAKVKGSIAILFENEWYLCKAEDSAE